MCDRLRSFDDLNLRNCKILPPTSLVNLEIILDLAEYQQILDMKSGITRDPIHPPVAQFKADGAHARVDIVLGTIRWATLSRSTKTRFRIWRMCPGVMQPRKVK